MFYAFLDGCVAEVGCLVRLLVEEVTPNVDVETGETGCPERLSTSVMG